nr:hypothetical protein [Nonomuraea zeae]
MPESFDGTVDGGGDLVLVSDIAGEGEHAVARVGELLRRRVQGGLVDVGEGDGCPGLGEGAYGGQPHPGTGSGDDGHLAGEVVDGDSCRASS